MRHYFKIACFALFSPLVLSACSIVSVKELPAELQVNATPITVEKPGWVFRSDAYNVALGAYSVSNARVKELKTTKTLVSKETEGRTLENLVIHGRLRPEIVEVRHYIKNSSNRYSFDIDFNMDDAFKAVCSLVRKAMYEEKKVKSSLYFGSKKKESDHRERPDDDAVWFQTVTSCRLTHQGEVWDINIKNLDQKPLVASLQSGSRSYVLQPLYMMREGSSELIVVAADDNSDLYGLALYFGVAIKNGEKNLATVSVEPNRDSIWIDPDLDEKELRFMLGVCYTLMLTEWLDTRSR